MRRRDGDVAELPQLRRPLSAPMRSARSLAQFAQSQSTLLLKDGIPLAHLTLVRVPSHAHDTHVGRLHASSPAYMRRMNPDMSSVVGHARHGLLEQQTRPTASVPSAGPPTAPSPQRPCVRGKFLFVSEEKLYVRGVTYGAFEPDQEGNEYQDLAKVERDFAQMATAGINAVRIPHTMPPRALLDVAQRHGLRVMVGLSAEQYVGYLIDRQGAPDVEALVAAKVRDCAGHPGLLCYALGNEIAAPMARWLGPERVQSYLERLYRVVKREDPEGLVTYVNYPTTEYLVLPFLDLLSFNVYLESQDRLKRYLARLQNIAGDRPLLMSELGLDSLRNGERAQAQVLDWQVRTAFAGGCAGVFIFSWTDEWYRHQGVADWAFGLTRADRSPKLGLDAVREAFDDVPFSSRLHWPRVSVVVCSYNGARTIGDCLDGLARLDYPDYEVIVVDDGSTDRAAVIARRYPVVVIQTHNQGLALARNVGLKEATGEIVAYIDDDARPDPQWLRYLAATFMSTAHAGVGGPNIAPPGDGPIAECVARAPGGPVHVLLNDREAEHIPGCNMAFRKSSLEAIGGFDPQFRTAGDDVDVCWRLLARGWTLCFHLAALVRHHRRNSLRTYWRQQIGFGRAEAMLERKWPEKYNGPGHVRWAGRIYGLGLTRLLGWRPARIYHGVWGSAPLWPRAASVWSGQGIPLDQRLRALETRLRSEGACVLRGEEHDCWDLEVRAGILGAARLLAGAEDHAGGKQLLRLRWWPLVPGRGPVLALAFAALAGVAAHAHLWGAAVLLGLGAVLPALNIVEQCMAGMATIRRALQDLNWGTWR